MIITNNGPWICFHCGETFHDPARAAVHFGIDELQTPGCVQILKNGEHHLLRRVLELQQDQSRRNAEDGDLDRWYSAKVVQHAAELNRVKEVEYARGLADAKKLLSEETEHFLVTREYPCLFDLLDRIAAQSGCGGFYEYSLPVRWLPWPPLWEKILRDLRFDRREAAGEPGKLETALFGVEPSWVKKTLLAMVEEFCAGEMG